MKTALIIVFIIMACLASLSAMGTDEENAGWRSAAVATVFVLGLLILQIKF